MASRDTHETVSGHRSMGDVDRVEPVGPLIASGSAGESVVDLPPEPFTPVETDCWRASSSARYPERRQGQLDTKSTIVLYPKEHSVVCCRIRQLADRAVLRTELLRFTHPDFVEERWCCSRQGKPDRNRIPNRSRGAAAGLFGPRRLDALNDDFHEFHPAPVRQSTATGNLGRVPQEGDTGQLWLDLSG
jgi:hypothetical protein